MNIDETATARILDAALTLCIHQGNATADEIAVATKFDCLQIKDALACLAQRGALVARPSGVYARPLVRHIRMPGESYISGLPPLPLARLMGAR